MPVDGPLYPVNLVLGGRRCLVVGGGPIAAGKAAELADCGAVVLVVAPAVSDEMAAVVSAAAGARPPIEVAARPFQPTDLDGCLLAVAATDERSVNHQVFVDGEARGVLVNSVDDPENCAFTTPARVRQGSLLLTISTEGRSPAVATWLRRQLEGQFGPEYAVLVDIVAEERERLRSRGQRTIGLDWQKALGSGMLELIREGHLAEAKERLQACLSSPSD
jgi:precorrin-2 dehydrogenase